MPTTIPIDLTLKNINLFAEEVLPALQPIWNDEGWEHEWWPTGMPQRAAAAV